MRPVEKLSEQALVPFDTDFRDWAGYRRVLEELYPEAGPGRILDVGGGNGRFLDEVLELFPEARGELVDNAPRMLAGNAPHPRKRLRELACEAIRRESFEEPFDLVTVNVLLHHLVAPSYPGCRGHAVALLRQLADLLAPGGRVLVYEQCYRPRSSWLPRPGRAIFQLSSLRIPPLPTLMRFLGANTAGVGVAFRGEEEWVEVLTESGFEVPRREVLEVDTPLWYSPLLNIGRCATVLLVGELPA